MHRLVRLQIHLSDSLSSHLGLLSKHPEAGFPQLCAETLLGLALICRHGDEHAKDSPVNWHGLHAASSPTTQHEHEAGGVSPTHPSRSISAGLHARSHHQQGLVMPSTGGPAPSPCPPRQAPRHIGTPPPIWTPPRPQAGFATWRTEMGWQPLSAQASAQACCHHTV